MAEQKALHTELSDAQKKIETLNTKLSAKVAETKAPGSAVKSTKTAMTGSSDAALIQQLKEDLYSDITGLIIRGVKREEDEDVFDCIQTGRNGSKSNPSLSNERHLPKSSTPLPSGHRIRRQSFQPKL